jgi:acyl-CoA dehydrogenase
VDPDEAPDDRAFRNEARAWLEANAPPRRPRAEEREHFERCRAWQRALFDGGWAGVAWPNEFGGRGASPWHAILFAQEQARVGATAGFLASTIGMVGPLLMEFGSEAQQRRFLRPLLRGDEAWCQLFSEPGAGSDLAGLTTRADRDGEDFVVNGQKVWTSNAQFCDWAILLARTDPVAPKHRGITFFIVDLRTPGIDIRPLRQITGTAHFNEVFLTDVRIPADNVVGAVDGGWAPARFVLAHEATVIGSGGTEDDANALIALARELDLGSRPIVRQRLAQAFIHERVLQYMQDRVLASVRDHRQAPVDGSVLKVFWSEARAERAEVGVNLLGPTGALEGVWPTHLLNRFWASIGGGTSEVHRTMIGERVLGLPHEPRADHE